MACGLSTGGDASQRNAEDSDRAHISVPGSEWTRHRWHPGEVLAQPCPTCSVPSPQPATDAQSAVIQEPPARVQWPSVCVCVCVCVCARARAKLLPLCPTPYNTMHCSSPGCSVHGILQARILEWFSMPSSRGSFQLRDRTRVSYIYLLWWEGSLPQVPPGKL